MEETTYRETEKIVLTVHGNDPWDEALAEEGLNEPGIFSLEDMFGDDEGENDDSLDTPSHQRDCCGGCPP